MTMKRFLISLAIGAVLTLLGSAAEYICWLSRPYLLFAWNIPGGECLMQYAFGLRAFHTYAMTPDHADTHSLRFTPFGFLVCTLLFALIVFLILTIISKLKKH